MQKNDNPEFEVIPTKDVPKPKRTGQRGPMARAFDALAPGKSIRLPLNGKQPHHQQSAAHATARKRGISVTTTVDDGALFITQRES